MSLTLYYHPLASYCHKALIALYENDIPFEKEMIDLSNQEQAAKLSALWPIRKFPVLVDSDRNKTMFESSVVIEYLARHYPGSKKWTTCIPADVDDALKAREKDRFFDCYIAEMTTKIVTDRHRPPGKTDPIGVADAKKMLRTALDMLDKDMAKKTWALGDSFTLADCAASPSLFYANIVHPFGDTHKQVKAYLTRLMERPAYARVLKEAEPYLSLMPKERESK